MQLIITKEESMAKKHGVTLLTIILCLSFSVSRSERSYAKDKKLTPEEVVAKHLESIGKPEILSTIKSRAVYGLAYIQRPIGTVPLILPEPGKRKDPSNFLIASEGQSLGMVMKFYDPEYPREHFAFDGKEATVSFVATNKKSLIGNFIDSHSGMMREGLLGGTLSTAWPLLNVWEGQFKLKYDQKNIDGTKYHQLTYEPSKRKHLDSILIHLFFDFESFRHVMTEYVLMGQINPTAYMFERFGNFRDVDGMMLPHNYSIEYNTWRGISPTLWAAEAKQILHNKTIDPQLFHTQ
jgi:hypothetical protein